LEFATSEIDRLRAKLVLGDDTDGPDAMPSLAEQLQKSGQPLKNPRDLSIGDLSVYNNEMSSTD
jgi:hypothetical protein